MPRRAVIFVLVLAAGIASAVALTVAPGARAWSIDNLPGGFSATKISAGGSCWQYNVGGYNAATSIVDCPDAATHADFEARLDAFIEANCPQDVCHPTTTSTSSDTLPVTTTAPTETIVPPVTATDTVASVPAPAPQPVPPTVTQTVIVETTLVDPTINDRLTLIEQQQAVDQARLDALEHPTGQILGEVKSQSPFTDPAL